jgi:hypothetical protein
MARPRTGRPRGRPHGSSRYRSADLRLGIECARRILSGLARDFPDAIRQIVHKADGLNTLRRSKERRLKRLCDLRGDWFLLQAKARPPSTRSSTGTLGLGIDPAILQVFESHERFARMANQAAREWEAQQKCFSEFTRHFEEHWRLLERSAQQMNAFLRVAGAN